MRLRLVVLISLATAVCCGALDTASAAAATRCVGFHPGCFATLQDALRAAHDGDTIRVSSGTFAGGVSIVKSVSVVGAGQQATVLRGGGPVVTVGAFGAEREPTVSISDLAITGGRTTSSPESETFTGRQGVLAHGGGINVPPGTLNEQDGTVAPGAALTLLRVTISDNRAAPTATAPIGPPCPGGDPCPFAEATGGGISSSGPLTIDSSTIRGNSVGSASGISDLASDADGGAIFHARGALTITRSRVTGNRAAARGRNARFAEGGGIFALGTKFTMRDSVLSGNSSLLESQLPNDVEQLANGGGVHITDAVTTAVVERTLIAGNSTRHTNSVGDTNAFSGGIHVDSPVEFTISDSVVTGNDASGATLGSSTGLAHADSGGGQLFGAMLRTSVRGNTVHADSQRGDAEAFAGGFWMLFGDVQDSELRDNRLVAHSPLGTATVRGAAAVVDSDPDAGKGGLNATRTSFRGNDGFARGRTTIGQGGGIFDGPVHADGPFGGPLTLVDSRVTHNVLRGDQVQTLQGGGVFSEGQPLTLMDTLTAHNKPDQCFGCGNTAAMASHRTLARQQARRGWRAGDLTTARLARR